MITEEMKIQALLQMIANGEINQILYKYREVGEYTEKIFTDHTLWFDHPNNFNDPFDCWANIQVLNKDAIAEFVVINSPNAYFAGKCKNGISLYTTDMLKQDIDNALKRIGVCCFSKTEKSILMWSHYCKYHTGICLEFDILEDPILFTFARPVNYVDTMPIYDHFNEQEKLIEKLIQPKAKEWEYEEEVRVVKVHSDIAKNKGSQAFKFKPIALRKVVFGCKASSETIEKYIKLCKQNGLEHVIFSQMRQKNNGKFELQEEMI